MTRTVTNCDRVAAPTSILLRRVLPWAVKHGGVYVDELEAALEVDAQAVLDLCRGRPDLFMQVPLADGHVVITTGICCYLIHFDRPYRHARHYIGFTRNLRLRLHTYLRGRRRQHRRNNALMAAVHKAGIEWTPVLIWPGEDHRFERHLKQSSGIRHCPICKPAFLRAKAAKQRAYRNQLAAGS